MSKGEGRKEREKNAKKNDRREGLKALATYGKKMAKRTTQFKQQNEHYVDCAMNQPSPSPSPLCIPSIQLYLSGKRKGENNSHGICALYF